jgi:hypothetical protein
VPLDEQMIAELQADPLWERDLCTGMWHKRTLEFIAERAESLEALVQQRKDAEITLAVAIISLEPDLPPQEFGPRCAIALNGVPYDVIASEIHPGEGMEWKGHSTPAAAIAAWKRALLEYVVTHSGDVLWWRIKPEIDCRIPFGETQPRWLVYSRLTIGNEADTWLAKIADGRLRPTHAMIADNLVTIQQLAELGYVVLESGNHPMLSNFGAEKIAPDVKMAFAAVIDALPPIIKMAGDTVIENVECFVHLQTQGEGKTLAEAVTAWGQNLLALIGPLCPSQLWWRMSPFADNLFGLFHEDETRRWMVYSRCSISVSPESDA